jgi:DNA-binding XRE family transcriptional regulator
MSLSKTEAMAAEAAAIRNERPKFNCYGPRPQKRGPIPEIGMTIRAARAYLDWKQSDLAKASGIAEVTIKKIERGGIDSRASTLDALQRAFERAGLILLEPGSTRDGGAGVRVKPSKPTRRGQQGRTPQGHTTR